MHGQSAWRAKTGRLRVGVVRFGTASVTPRACLRRAGNLSSSYATRKRDSSLRLPAEGLVRLKPLPRATVKPTSSGSFRAAPFPLRQIVLAEKFPGLFAAVHRTGRSNRAGHSNGVIHAHQKARVRGQHHFPAFALSNVNRAAGEADSKSGRCVAGKFT